MLVSFLFSALGAVRRIPPSLAITAVTLAVIAGALAYTYHAGERHDAHVAKVKAAKARVVVADAREKATDSTLADASAIVTQVRKRRKPLVERVQIHDDTTLVVDSTLVPVPAVVVDRLKADSNQIFADSMAIRAHVMHSIAVEQKSAADLALAALEGDAPEPAPRSWIRRAVKPAGELVAVGAIVYIAARLVRHAGGHP